MTQGSDSPCFYYEGFLTHLVIIAFTNEKFPEEACLKILQVRLCWQDLKNGQRCWLEAEEFFIRIELNSVKSKARESKYSLVTGFFH